MTPVLSFLAYLGTAAALLAAFIFIYTRITPYNELEQIAQNNVAAAITLTGALLGFSITLAASIYFTHSLVEMCKWAAITTSVQLALFYALRRAYAPTVEKDLAAPAVFLAGLSVALGILNAMSISY